MKKKYSLLLVFIFAFIISFLHGFINFPKLLDGVWNYGFGYNIATGLIPYRDFNMIITPLYPFILSLFIRIIGNSYYCIIILDSILVASIVTIMAKTIGKKSLILLPLIIGFGAGCYNLLTLFLFMVLVLKNESKYQGNAYLTGLIIALLLLSKQTVGGLLLIITFIQTKNKKNYLIGFLPLCILFLLYLGINGALYDFFNYCLFGMLDFTGDNGLSRFSSLTILYIVILILLVIIERKNIKQLTLYLAFQIMSMPLLDPLHIFIAIIPIFYYLITKTYNNAYINIAKKAIMITSSCLMLICIILFSISNSSKMYIYKNSNSPFNLTLSTINFELEHQLKEILTNDYSDYKQYYLIDYAYLIKLENNDKINKYDLINNGNMGYHGEDKYIKEIDDYCIDNKCMMLISTNSNNMKGHQTSKKIINYVKSTYKYQKSIYIFDIYTN